MPLRRIYAHWLDPELMSRRFPSSTTGKERLEEFEDLLKLHALLGYSVCLSDVQLIDSYTILTLFSREDFKTFLWSDPFLHDRDMTFLRVVSRACDWELGSLKLRVLANGLSRATDANWRSSIFPDGAATQKIGEIFKARKMLPEYEVLRLFEDTGDLGKLRETADSLVRGMINALEYFVQFPNNVEESPISQTQSYYNILCDSKAKVDAHNDSILCEQLDSTLRYVEQLPNRYQRTPAVFALANDGLHTKDNLIRYLHVLQAWNFGVSGTVGANLDSGTGWGVPSIAHLHGQADNWTVPVDALDDRELFENCFGTKWHPSMTPWSAIGKLRSHCEREIRSFQSSIGRGNAWPAFTELVAAITEKEATRLGSFPHVPRPVVHIAEVLRTAGPIGVCLMGLIGASSIFGTLDPKTALSIITALAAGIVLPRKIGDLREHQQAKRMAMDLECLARKYNLFRERPGNAGTDGRFLNSIP